MAMTKPPHPVRSIQVYLLEPLGLNATDAAKGLDMARHTLSRVLNSHACGNLAGDGDSTRKSWLVERRVLAVLPDGI